MQQYFEFKIIANLNLAAMSYTLKSIPSYGHNNGQFKQPVSHNKAQINFIVEKSNYSMNHQMHGKINDKPQIIIPQSIFPAIPITKNPPSFNNISKPEDNKIYESKDKLKSMNEDLSKLKNRFQNLVTDYPATNSMNNYPLNSKSSDNLYSPFNRISSINSPQDEGSFVKKAEKEINQKSETQAKSIKTQMKKQFSEQKPLFNKIYQFKQNNYSIEPKLKLPLEKQQFQIENPRKTKEFQLKYSDRLNFDTKQYINNRSLSSYTQKNAYPQKQLNENKTLNLSSANDFNNLKQNKSFSSFNYNETDREYKKIINDINHQLLIQREREKIELEKKLDEMKVEKNNLCNENESLKTKIQSLNIKIEQLTNKNTQIVQQFQQSKKRQGLLTEKAIKIQKQLLQIKNRNRNSYDDVLKTQMEQTKQIVKLIQQKNDQITKLNQTIFMNRRKTEEAVNNAEIERLKYMAEKKQIQKLNEIQILNRNNEIKNLKNALETMSAKLKVAIKDNKSKDEFLQQYLTGRAKNSEQKDHIASILSKYEAEYPKNNLIEKLMEQQKQIQRLKQLIQNNSRMQA